MEILTLNLDNKISIVTPSYNQGQYIEETICSILDQNYPALEYIIIDGGSTDNSVKIIKKYQRHLKFWVSEKDRGQVNAINKGLKYCTGEIFNWLNSDDYLEPEALYRISDAFKNNSVNLVAGKVNNFTNTSSVILANQNLSAKGLMCWKPGVQFSQPGVWMRRQNFIDCGGIDENLHFAFDWDLLIRYLYFFPHVKYLEDILVHFRIHEESKTGSSLDKFIEEEIIIIEKLKNDKTFLRLYNTASYKIKRKEWFKFLNEVTARNNSRSKKLLIILKHLYLQPFDWPVSRITLGAIKNIFSNKN